MRVEILAILAAVALGTTGALAQTTGESPADPKIEQNAPSAEPAQPADPKARMPMRRELPIVPDPKAPSSEGAGAGTSGAGTSGADVPSATEPAPTEPAQKEEKKY